MVVDEFTLRMMFFISISRKRLPKGFRLIQSIDIQKTLRVFYLCSIGRKLFR